MANILTRWFGSKDPKKNLGTTINPVGLQRSRQNVQSWRNAVIEAEQAYNPYRVKMQRLFADNILNGHVSACVEYRKNLTLLRDFELLVNGEESEYLETLFSAKWFYELISYCLDAKFYGYSLISLGDIVDSKFNEISLIKRENISPDRLVVSKFEYTLTGESFTEKPYDLFHIWVDTPSENGHSRCGYGILYKVALYEIFCRNLIGFNMDATELFGMPIRWGKTTKTEESERQAFQDAIQYMGSAGWIVTDMMDEIQLIANGQSGNSYMIYENLEQRCEKKISKVILGHADAMDSIAGKLGNDTGESPAKKAIENIKTLDGKFIEEIVNNQLIPKLRKIGFNIPENVEFKYSNSHEEFEEMERKVNFNKTFAEVAQTMKNAGLQMDAKYFENETGIPTTQVVQLGQPISNSIKNKLNEIYK